MKIIKYAVFLILVIFIFSGCTLTNKNATRPVRDTGATGSIIAQAEWPDDVTPELVTVRMTVSASDMETVSQDFSFMSRSGEIYGIHGVSAGDNRAVTFEGLSADNTRLYEGALSDLTVIAGQITDSGLISMNPVQYVSTTEKVMSVAIPTNIRAEAGNGEVLLSWESTAGADSYSIYMSTSPGVSKSNFEAWQTTTSTFYKWSGLDNGTPYYFVVTGESSESSEVNAIPRIPEAAPPRKSVRKKAPLSKKTPVPAAAVAPVTEKAPVAVPMPAKPTPAPVKAPEPTPAPVKKTPDVKAAELSPAELLKIADQIRAPSATFSQEIKVTFKKGDEETVNILATRVKDSIKSLAVYKYPASQKGRVILMVENNMWIYFPGTKKPIRISPAQQLLGQVSNADVSRVVYSIDYEALSVEDDNTGKEKLLKLNLKAKTRGASSPAM